MQLRKNKSDQKLEMIQTLVGWEGVINFVKKLIRAEHCLTKDTDRYLLIKIKILFLQFLYSLSDRETEYLVHDRISFRNFSGLNNCIAILNFNDVWQLREQLEQSESYSKCINYIMEQIGEKGMTIKKGIINEVAVIDLKSILSNL